MYAFCGVLGDFLGGPALALGPVASGLVFYRAAPGALLAIPSSASGHHGAYRTQPGWGRLVAGWRGNACAPGAGYLDHPGSFRLAGSTWQAALRNFSRA